MNNFESLNNEEKEAFKSFKRAFYPISDEEAYSLVLSARELTKVGNVKRSPGRDIGSMLRKVLSKITI